MKRAFIFPGQGSQQVGMGKALAAASATARQVFEEVDDALQAPLSRLMFDGPADELTLTANAQPAIMANAIAVFRVLMIEGGHDLAATAACVAGHSLGEYSALCAAGSFSLADTARLLRLRGQAMQAAVPAGDGAMAALIGLDIDAAHAIAAQAAQGDVCALANDNAPGQVVLSGMRAAVERAIDLAKEKGARRAILLPVSAPFHCEAMRPAADAMAQALAQTPPLAPQVPLIANVTASRVDDPARIRELLVEQVTARVRWRESIAHIATEYGIEEFVEFGGKVLGPMVKRIAPDARATSLIEMDDITALAAQL